MEFSIINLLKDDRTHCISVMTEASIEEYLQLVDQTKKLLEQRDVLKTSSAITIRKRLIEDLKEGAVIPPLVLGVLVQEDIHSINNENVCNIINANQINITIIDGIQRTESLIKAKEQKDDIKQNKIRLEFWISNNVSSLIYRMLVLNTGQVPWNVRRQIEVVYRPLIQETQNKVEGIILNNIGDNERRKQGGEYPASSIVELFMAFGSKKEIQDTREKLADDFTRLDIIKMTGEQNYPVHFYTALQLMVDFDKTISIFEAPSGDGFNSGRDLFTSTPARIGFIVAIAQEVLGRAGGIDRAEEEQNKRINAIKGQLAIMLERISRMENEELNTFLSFSTLNEVVKGLPIKRIGDSQRDFFRAAFSSLINFKFEISSLNEAWMAY